MENPFTHLKNKNKKLSIIAIILICIIPVIIYFTYKYTEVYFKNVIVKNTVLEQNQTTHQQEINTLRYKLDVQSKELHKLTVSKMIIKDFILQTNNDIQSTYADKLATKIVYESENRGNSPYVQAALLASESSFESNPKHAISTVFGMGGVYWNIWSDKLVANKIVNDKNDLKNPYTNIKASAYILSCYMDNCKTPRLALAHYKGYSKLGISQANNVMITAIKLKSQERAYNV